jgi:hypothetical protein
MCMYSPGGKAFSSQSDDFVEERGASATVEQNKATHERANGRVPANNPSRELGNIVNLIIDLRPGRLALDRSAKFAKIPDLKSRELFWRAEYVFASGGRQPGRQSGA